MSMISNILSMFVGTKTQRDLQEIQPMVEIIKATYQEIINLSNDELRIRSTLLKTKVRESIADDEKIITELKHKGENDDTPIDEIESIYTQVDKLEKEIEKKI